jgi:zinc and cadmium transporter
VVIAAAFLTSIPLGVATAIAVITHEVPQEVGDFAILLESGYSRSKALALNTLSAAATLPGALAAYFWLADTRELVPYVLADLVPNLHRRVSLTESARQIALLLLGIGTIALLRVGHGG